MTLSSSLKYALRAAGPVSRRAVVLFVVGVLVVWSGGCGKAAPSSAAPQMPAEAPKADATAAQPSDRGATPAASKSVASDASASVTLADEAQMKALLDGTKGKVLVVNVWATFCIPCIQEMPLLSAFYQKMDPSQVAFLSISANMPRSLDDTVKPFVADHKVSFPVTVLNFDDPDPNILAAMLGVKETGWDGALPATFVFDRNHVLQAHVFEELQPGQLEKLVGPLLASS